MKVQVDSNKCTGHARCLMTAPEVYVLDDEGYNRMGEFAVKPGLEDQARRGARSCPERAIVIAGEPA